MSWIHAPTPTGGTLLASHVIAQGGAALDDPTGSGFWAASPAFECSGTTYLTDSTLNGGSGMVPFGMPGPGATALVGNPNTQFARTLLNGGPGTTPGPASSGGVQHVTSLVGIELDHGLQLGQTTTVTAIAGSSQPLGIGGGFSAVPSSVPIIVEPVFGQQLIPLTLAQPVAGTPVNALIPVPNNPTLTGICVWAQAFQLDAPVVRASSLVGGAIH